MILDAVAFVAVERGDRTLLALAKSERLANRACRTHGGVVGQVWRGGSGRQANLSRFLAGVDVDPLDDALGRRAETLLGKDRSKRRHRCGTRAARLRWRSDLHV